MTRIKIWSIATAITLLGGVASAETELETAINNGGERLGADQIAGLLIGKVVTAKAGEQTFRFFYDPNNVLHGELANRRWKGTGAFAITDGDQVGVSMATDNGRYQCLKSVRVRETVQKFDADDKMTFELTGFESATGL